jgi:serine/threonine protein kinase
VKKPAGASPEATLPASTADVVTAESLATDTVEIGAHLGQFRIEEKIGEGGLGVVYRAYDAKLMRPVAIKVLSDSSSSAVRLLDEARAAAALTHPSIAVVHDVQQREGHAFIVMELVVGETLRAAMGA